MFNFVFLWEQFMSLSFDLLLEYTNLHNACGALRPKSFAENKFLKSLWSELAVLERTVAEPQSVRPNLIPISSRIVPFSNASSNIKLYRKFAFLAMSGQFMQLSPSLGYVCQNYDLYPPQKRNVACRWCTSVSDIYSLKQCWSFPAILMHIPRNVRNRFVI